MSDFNELKNKILNFRDERNWQQFHQLHHLISALSIEVGELSELVLWKNEDEIKDKLKNKSFHENLSDECADILNYLILISESANINLIESSLNKLDKNKNKYPISKSYGKSTKYTKLDD